MTQKCVLETQVVKSCKFGSLSLFHIDELRVYTISNDTLPNFLNGQIF